MTSGELNGYNLYAYCYNNPVNNVDPSGRFVLTALAIGLIVGAIIGATVGGIVAYDIASESGATGWELFGWTMLGAIGGGIIGGAIGAGIGYGLGLVFPAINTFLASSFTIGGGIGGGFALAGGGVLGGGVAISVSTVVAAGAAVAGAIGLGYILMSKPNSGRPRYSDGTGYTDNGRGGRRPMTQEEAHSAYKASKDPVYKANLKRWMKGQGYRTSHLKGLILLPLIGEWLRRIFTGEWL